MEVGIKLYKYSGEVVSDLKMIKSFLENIIEDIGNLIENQDTMFEIRLILNELVINSAIHGNNMEVDKLINLNILLENNMFEAFVEDQGEGIEFDCDSYNADDLKCCGRGLVIVSKLTDEMNIYKNKIEIRKQLV